MCTATWIARSAERIAARKAMQFWFIAERRNVATFYIPQGRLWRHRKNLI
jgi:DNA integrity scanning protein DisA with diadenylate cyclase activity